MDDLYNSVDEAIPPPDALLLHQEKNLMLHNMVDYSSEISQYKCMQESDLPACGPFSGKTICARPGLEVITLEFILKLKIKRNDLLLVDTFPQAANHCSLF